MYVYEMDSFFSQNILQETVITKNVFNIMSPMTLYEYLF